MLVLFNGQLNPATRFQLIKQQQFSYIITLPQNRKGMVRHRKCAPGGVWGGATRPLPVAD